MFFIFWRGWGIAAVGAWILSAAIFTIGAEALLGAPRADAIQTWLSGPVCLLAAAFVFFLARFLDDREPRIYVDKQTGREIAVRRRHELFFIPLAYWAPIFGVLGLALIVWKLLGGG